MKNKMNWIDYVCAVFILFLLPYILHVLICSYFFLFDFFSPFYTHFVRKCRSVEVCVCKYKIVKSPPLPTRLTALFPSVCYFFHLALIIAIVPTLFRLAPFFVSSCVVCVPTRTLYFHTHRCWFDLTKWCFYVRVLIEYVRLFALSHYNKKNVSHASESVADDDDDVDDGIETNSKKHTNDTSKNPGDRKRIQNRNQTIECY